MQEDADDYPGMPRWLKIAGIIVIVLVMLAVGAMLLMGGEHGPGRHGLSLIATDGQ